MPTRLINRMLELLRGGTGDLPTTTQTQREALLDLLAWTMLADRHVASAEQNHLREHAAGLPWDSQRPVEVYLDGALRRARQAIGTPAQEDAHLAAIASRLGDEATRRRALEACKELAGADGDVAPSESQHLDRLRASLGLK